MYFKDIQAIQHLHIQNKHIYSVSALINRCLCHSVHTRKQLWPVDVSSFHISLGANSIINFLQLQWNIKFPLKPSSNLDQDQRQYLQQEQDCRRRQAFERQLEWAWKQLEMMIRTFTPGQIQPRDTLSGWIQLAKVTGTFANLQFWRTGAITIMATITISFPFTFETHFKEGSGWFW